ncbi:MAG: hypothetical protein ABEK17_03770 [Candidatus Aenigmatarchaeota archaeon]
MKKKIFGWAGLFGLTRVWDALVTYFFVVKEDLVNFCVNETNRDFVYFVVNPTLKHLWGVLDLEILFFSAFIALSYILYNKKDKFGDLAVKGVLLTFVIMSILAPLTWFVSILASFLMPAYFVMLFFWGTVLVGETLK